MAASEREVAGLRCSQVLEYLSDYLDGELDAELVAKVEGHLRGCDWCERFSTRFTGVIRQLRIQLKAPDPVQTDVADRLVRRLRSVSS